MSKTPKRKITEARGVSTSPQPTDDGEISTSETEVLKSPGKLQQEVQTIIDIMGPAITHLNSSSEADNEESIYTNSKLSSVQMQELKRLCSCNVASDSKTNLSTEPTSKCEDNMSTVAGLNTSTSMTIEDLDSKATFPYLDNYCCSEYNICPPPLVPANVCINSECFCPQVASILHGKGFPCNMNGSETKYREDVGKDYKNILTNWFKTMVTGRDTATNTDNDYYKMNVKRNRGDDHSPPRKVVFELIEGTDKANENCSNICIPEKDKSQKNCKNQRLQTKAEYECFCKKKSGQDSRKSIRTFESTTYCDARGKSRVDVYYFDHGSFNHFQTTDAPPMVSTEQLADKTEKHTTRFWAEIFGTLHIGFSFVTSFVLQLFRFCLYSVLRPLTIGLIQLAADYFFKPLLATIFNGILQPIFILFYNIFTSIRDILDPVAEAIGYFCKEFAALVKSFRIVDVKTENCKCQGDCICEKRSKKNKMGC